jgi:membrane protein
VLAVAGIAALVGKNQVSQATPPLPTEAIDGAKRDAEALKGRHPRTTINTTPGGRR